MVNHPNRSKNVQAIPSFGPQSVRIAGSRGFEQLYRVELSSDGNHLVQVEKHRSSGAYLHTIKPKSAIWNRAVKQAYTQSGMLRQ